MMDDSDILKIANDSGFPLQIAIEHKIRTSTPNYGWQVRYTEHSWTNRLDNQSGFIDLVLQRHSISLIVECKRVKNSTWLFLRSDGNNHKTCLSKCWISYLPSSVKRYFGWNDIEVQPPSYEALFCAIRGQTSSEKMTMLERTAGEVISATEALAREEQDFTSKVVHPMRLYFNVIVTTANLKVAKFLPENISLLDGTITESDFEDVPFVRFRKQMSMRETKLTFEDFKDRYDQIANSKENTVFIVRADSILEFLSQFDVSEETIRALKF